MNKVPFDSSFESTRTWALLHTMSGKPKLFFRYCPLHFCFYDERACQRLERSSLKQCINKCLFLVPVAGTPLGCHRTRKRPRGGQGTAVLLFYNPEKFPTCPFVLLYFPACHICGKKATRQDKSSTADGTIIHQNKPFLLSSSSLDNDSCLSCRSALMMTFSPGFVCFSRTVFTARYYVVP